MKYTYSSLRLQRPHSKKIYISSFDGRKGITDFQALVEKHLKVIGIF